MPNSNIFKNTNEIIRMLEYLGRIFKLDDSRIYSINEYNKKIKDALDRIELKEVKNIKNIDYKEYPAAYYLYYDL